MALVLLALPGCADPRSDMLAANSVVTLHDDRGRAVSLDILARSRDGGEDLRSVELPVGTRVVVLVDAPPAPRARSDLRLVVVRVAEGPHRGLVGHVGRFRLRPERAARGRAYTVD